VSPLFACEVSLLKAYLHRDVRHKNPTTLSGLLENHNLGLLHGKTLQCNSVCFTDRLQDVAIERQREYHGEPWSHCPDNCTPYLCKNLFSVIAAA